MTKTRRGRRHVVDEHEAPPPPKTLEDATRWLSWISWAVTVGKIDARTAHEAAYALRAFLTGRQTTDRTDERIRTLERTLAQLKDADR